MTLPPSPRGSTRKNQRSSQARLAQVILDAANVGTTGQLLLAASLSGNGSQPLQLVNGSTLSWAGSVWDSSPSHIDAGGSTVVELQLSGVPATFLGANYTCLFLDFGQIRALEKSALQVHLPATFLAARRTFRRPASFGSRGAGTPRTL